MKIFKIIIIKLLVLASVGGLLLTACTGKEKDAEKKEIRIGYFPNITHSQALVGLSRGIFKKNLGNDANIKTTVFNAGPEEIEALFSGNIDIGYIGPSPAVNGFIKSEGKALKIIAGSSSGGAVLVARKDAGVSGIKDLDGKKVATPQIGNTQDVALRHFLAENNLKAKEKGGSVEIIPTENANTLTLFKKKELDAAWVPEPWGSRLADEADAKIVIDERNFWPQGKFTTANVIVNTDFLKSKPELVEKFLKGHVETTEWINANLESAKTLTNTEIEKITSKSLKRKVINDAFSRLTVTYDPVSVSVIKSSLWAYDLGFIKTDNLTGIYDLSILNKILKEKGKETVK